LVPQLYDSEAQNKCTVEPEVEKALKQCIVFGAEIHFNFQTTHQQQQFSTLHAVLVQQIVSVIVVTIYKEWHCATFTLSIVACKPLHTFIFKMIDTINFSKYTFILKFTCSSYQKSNSIHSQLHITSRHGTDGSMRINIYSDEFRIGFGSVNMEEHKQ